MTAEIRVTEVEGEPMTWNDVPPDLGLMMPYRWSEWLRKKWHAHVEMGLPITGRADRIAQQLAAGDTREWERRG